MGKAQTQTANDTAGNEAKSNKKTIDAAPEQKTTRLSTQQINDMWIHERYEVWRSGVFKRKSLTVDGEAPTPNLYEDCPIDYLQKGNLEQVAGRPIYISAIGTQEDDSAELIALTYLHSVAADDSLETGQVSGPRWVTTWVKFSQIANAQKLLELAETNVLPVRSSNMRALSDFLTDCYDANIDIANRTTVVKRQGMHVINGSYGWLVGHHWIGPGSVRPNIEATNPFASAIGQRGTLEEWKAFAEEQWKREPFLRWTLGVSFASPLLEFIGLRTFFVHHYSHSGNSKCVTGDTLVYTKAGIKRIADLAKYRTTRGVEKEYGRGFTEIPGNRKLTFWNGDRWVTASHFFREKAQTVRIRSERGYELTGTPEHPVWTDSGWVKLSDVQVGTRVQIQKPEQYQNSAMPKIAIRPAQAGTNAHRLTEPVVIDMEMARVLGYFVADGYNKPEGVFSLTSDMEVLEDVAEVFQRRFGVEAHITPVEKDNTQCLRLGHTELRRVFEDAGVGYDLAAGKSVPWSVLTSHRGVLREFLRGYFSCEGVFEWKVNQKVEICSASEQLAREIQNLLLVFGVTSSRGCYPVDGVPYWKVTVYSAHDIVRFAQEIGVVTSTRTQELKDQIYWCVTSGALGDLNRLKHSRELPYFETVVVVEDAGEQEVYDVTIPDGHAFMTNAFVSHNTTSRMFSNSVWAHPRRWMRPLNQATQGSLTEQFKYVSSLPVHNDELQGANISLSDYVMQVTSEEHKQRSTITGGLQVVSAKQWRQIICTTGEQTLAGADKTDLGGQQNRTLEFRHPGLTREHGKDVWAWVERCKTYGTAGPAFLAKLSTIVNDENKLHSLIERYRSFVKVLETFTGQSRATEQQMGAIALGEYLMLHWIFGYARAEAIEIAISDSCTMLQNWMRHREGNVPLWRRGADIIVEHRYAYAHLYADISTPEGRQKLAQFGSRTSMPLVGCVNAGLKGDEVWYMPNALRDMIQRALQAPPDRLLEELAAEGILDRGSDRLVRHREVDRGKTFQGKVLVMKAEKLFGAIDPGPQVDVSALLLHSLDDQDMHSFEE